MDRLNNSGAIFDRVKLKWVNAMHLRALPSAALWNLINPYLVKAGFQLPQSSAWQEKSIAVFKSYMEIISDAVELYRPLDDASFVIHPEAAEIYTWEPSKNVLNAWRDFVAVHPREDITEEEFMKIQDEVKNITGAKGKNLFQPIRVAVIGKPHGAELKILVPLMSKSSLIARADKALAHQ